MASSFYLLLILTATIVSSESKLESLKELSEREGGVVSLTIDTFKKFVIEQNKSYILVILFSTKMSKLYCTQCEKMQKVFEKISESYKIHAESFQNSESAKKPKPVFFGSLDYEPSTQEIFQLFQFTNIPNIYVSTKALTLNGRAFGYSSEKMWQLRGDEEITPEKVITFINTHTSYDVKVVYTWAEFLVPYMMIGGAVMVVAGVVTGIYVSRYNPMLYWFLAMIVNIVCIGGVVYDILQSPPITGVKENGEQDYFASGPRSQYVLEGFLVSFVMVLGGSALICVNYSAKFESPWVMRIIGYISVLLFCACVYSLDYVYKMKVSWYKPLFTPPPNYIKGSLLRDQGNSF